MAVQIRDARPEDEASCAAMLAELRGAGEREPDAKFAATFAALVGKERGQVVVADDDGVIRGMVTVSYNVTLRHGGEYCQLEELIVSATARGQNLGGRLVQAAVDNAAARGCAEIGLYLVERTEHNRPFYAKYGFEAVGTEMRQRLPPGRS